MRFNSYEFILLFLPVVWLFWQTLLRTAGVRWAAAWLTLASFGFYAWWDWRYAPLLGLSLLANFAIGRHLVRPGSSARRVWLAMGLIWNLSLLIYFKYAGFFVEVAGEITGADWPTLRLVLPLGISFFTFQKIAFLVDAYRGRISSVRWGDFALFVLFFPQLIAGPIVHHGEFIPQLHRAGAGRADARTLTLGLMLFSAGLFQKTVIADTLAPVADSAFGVAASGVHLRLLEAWVGVLAYALQLFNDFSGYSHMAMGLALLFGFRLPINFLAPYRANNLIDFWRRWHVTLSAFLRDYVYIPLGGNRRGFPRHLAALFITMMVAGAWHGAGWTFLAWGAWHGVALVFVHVYSRVKGSPPGGRASWGLTMVIVCCGWVFFRAPDLTTARSILESLLGGHGISVPIAWMENVKAFAPVIRPRGLFPSVHAPASALIVLVIAAAAACSGPTLLRWLGVSAAEVTHLPKHDPGSLAGVGEQLGMIRVVAAAAMLALGLSALSRTSPFLYFQF